MANTFCGPFDNVQVVHSPFPFEAILLRPNLMSH
jgi:hypothetical protein